MAFAPLHLDVCVCLFALHVPKYLCFDTPYSKGHRHLPCQGCVQQQLQVQQVTAVTECQQVRGRLSLSLLGFLEELFVVFDLHGVLQQLDQTSWYHTNTGCQSLRTHTIHPPSLSPSVPTCPPRFPQLSSSSSWESVQVQHA